MTNIPGNNLGLAISNAVADAVEQAGALTVLVNARRRLPVSGIRFGADLVLTASHGVEREEDISVVLPDGSEQPATLAGRDRGTDLAVLRLQGGVGGAVAQPGVQEARVGHLVVAVGRPSSDGVQASLGLVTAVGSGLHTMGGGILERYLVTDAVPYPGFSGGPLVDLGGNLLGINTSGLVRGSSLAITARLAWQVAQNLAEHGHIKRGFLGVRSQAVELPGQSAGAQKTGLLIIGVETDGPAAKAGLMVGDIITGIDGQAVTDHDELLARLTGDVVGRAVPVQVLRGGQAQTLSLTPAERE